jgi:hypothetical protein
MRARGHRHEEAITFGSLLLLSSALIAPAAFAQARPGRQPAPAATTSPAQTATPGDATADPAADDPEEEIEISAPAPIRSRARRSSSSAATSPTSIRSTPEVVSVLSAEDIARTGEGDIAGALQRVTGLSVVGSGFVFVRGLGDRYSLALLNGSPLPSPEPLRRVVPLDIFPTSVIASSLVQKSYSVNYPGEFGGGVINLTTISIPREPFLSFGASIGRSTPRRPAKLGYTYFGSDLDFLGFDDGSRDFPAASRRGQRRQLRQHHGGPAPRLRGEPAQRRDDLAPAQSRHPGQFLRGLSGGTTFDIGGGRIGVIAAAGYSSNWRTRDALQQTSLDPELAGTPQTSFRTVITDNRVIVNGLLGLGAEFGEHELRWTNLYIRDTLKQGRLASRLQPQRAGSGSEPAALAHRAEHLLVRAAADRHAVRRRVQVRRSQPRPARHLCQLAARIAV